MSPPRNEANAEITSAVPRVWVSRSGEVVSRGSGFLVTERLVLTCSHVVTNQAADPIRDEITLYFGNRAISARLVRHDEVLDWAILEAAELPGMRPLALAELHLEASTWIAWGYPKLSELEGKTVLGRFLNRDATFRGQPVYELLMVEGADVPISGLSGGPCLVEGAAIGLMRGARQDPQTGGLLGGSLYAVPMRLILAACADILPPLDPCRELPPLPSELLPPRNPFRYLHAFERAHSVVFFGRCREIRALHDCVTRSSAHLVALYGPTGVGKSSLIAAGLAPRLQGFTVRTIGRDPTIGVLTSLLRALPGEGTVPLGTAWRQLEAESGKPALLILDQLEHVVTRPHPNGPQAELVELFVAFAAAFAAAPDPTAQAPAGTLLLSFRKEWFSDIDRACDAAGVTLAKVALERMDTRAIIEVVTSLVRSEPLRQVYHLSVEEGLAERIAADLLRGKSPVAPALQILLTRMWETGRTGSPGALAFTLALYERIAAEGYGLRDFLQQQLDKLRHSEDAALVGADASGLVLDVLDFHVSLQITTEQRSRAELNVRYADKAEIASRVAAVLKDLHLLVEPAEPTIEYATDTRLVHDTLAPAVREFFSTSLRPGQRARVLLETRAVEWQLSAPADGPPLDDHDLAVVEKGLSGMRALNAIEGRLLVASRTSRAEREAARQREALLRAQREAERARRTLAATAVLALLLVIAVMAGLQAIRKSSEANQREAEAKQSAAKALQAGEKNRQQTLDTYIERGYQLLFAEDRPDEALLWLHRAYKEGSNSPVLLDLLREARYGVEATRTVLVGHLGKLKSAMYSPDGKRIVTASDDHSARIWDADTGSQLAALRGHTATVRSAAYSPDGKRIVTASDDHTARVWDAETGSQVAECKGHGAAVWNATYSPDGKRIVTASDDHTVRVWDADTGHLVRVLTGHGANVNSALYRPGGKQIVTASDDHTARVWDAETGRLVAVLKGHEEKVWRAMYSPDGKRIVTASWDKTARVWDAETGQKLAVLTGHRGVVLSATYSPDGKRIVTASWDKTARVWDAETGQKLAVLTGHGGVVFGATHSPDGKRILTASDDHTVRAWDAETGQKLAVLTGHRGIVVSATYSPDGERILTTSDDHTARVWNSDMGKKTAVLAGHEDSVYGAAYSSDGKRIVTASRDHTARVWHAETGQRVMVLSGHGDSVNSATYRPDGKRIVTASYDHTTRVWDAETGRQVTVLTGHEDSVNSARYSSDGKHIVTASWDKTARVWDAETGWPVVVLRGHEASVFSGAYSPDGKRIVTASYDRTARVWDAETGRQVTVLRGHGFGVYSAAYSPDGKRIVTASYDRTARVWDAETGHQVTLLTGHGFGVYSGAYSPDGKHIVTASFDNTAQVWDAGTGQKVAVLTGHGAVVQSAMYSPDGRRIVTASWDMTARVWDVVPEMESADQIARLIRCKVGAHFAREDSNLIIPGLPHPTECLPNPQPPSQANSPAAGSSHLHGGSRHY